MKRIRAYLHVVWASVLLAAACAPASAATSRIFDCPLRDARFSIDSPLVDLLLSDSAKAVIDRHTAARSAGTAVAVPSALNSEGEDAIALAAEAAGWVGLCLACGRGGDGRDFPVRAGVSAAGGRSGGAPGRRIHWARSDDGGLGLTIKPGRRSWLCGRGPLNFLSA